MKIKKSYFILEPVGFSRKHKTTKFWTQEVDDFCDFIQKHTGELARARYKFFWRNKEIAFAKLLKRVSSYFEKQEAMVA
jgi:hypothetical protein